MRVTGVEQIDRVLKGLPLQLSDKVLQNAFADAAKPLVQTAQSLAPKLTGGLSDSIGVVKEKSIINRSIGEIQVGPRRKGKYKGFHAPWFEFGTSIRKTSSGANRGSIKPEPFMEPAFNQTNTQVEGRINVSIGRKLVAFMRRTIKNA
jgi:HK97 gp10 family phage protein